MLNGTCACGAVRFEVDDDFVYAGHCHCAQCRAASGAAFATFAAIERGKLAIVAGAARTATYTKGERQTVTFCCGCGVALFVDDGEFVRVPLGVLRAAPRIAPSFHAFVGSKAPWYEIADGLPQYPGHAPLSEIGVFTGHGPGATRAAQSSRVEYSRRLRRVLDHLDAHLDAPLDLDAVSRIAHFSPFHFHRVFAAWLGETPGEYLRNRRLDRAATQLVSEPHASVLSVAIAVGFGSGEALARAFKQRFGCTPSAWRAEAPRERTRRVERLRALQPGADGKPGAVQRKTGQAIGAAADQHRRGQQTCEVPDMNVKIVDFPATRVAYLRSVGPFGPNVGRFWNETVLPWMGAHGLSERARYGIGLDDPAVTPPEQCRYDACVEVPADFVAEQPAALTTLPAGRYAVREFNGSPDTINAAWNEVFREWLPSSGMQMDARPCVEYYRGGSPVDAKTGAFECELWVPVTPLR